MSTENSCYERADIPQIFNIRPDQRYNIKYQEVKPHDDCRSE